MRKAPKSVLGQLMKWKVEPQTEFPENSIFVIDVVTYFVLLPGLHIQHMKTCAKPVSYIENPFGLDTVVVFDGYDSNDSTKIAEQLRIFLSSCSCKQTVTAK